MLLAVGRADVALVGLSSIGFSETTGPLLVGGDGTGCCNESKGAADISSCNITDNHSSNPLYSNAIFCRIKIKGTSD